MEQNPKQIPLFNPLSDDFTFEWKDDTNTLHTFTMRPLEITYFDKPIADFMARHLCDAVYHIRGQKTNAVDDMKAIMGEIHVTE